LVVRFEPQLTTVDSLSAAQSDSTPHHIKRSRKEKVAESGMITAFFQEIGKAIF
jgi:hypothetical protein